MKTSAGYVCVILHEIVSVCDAPLHVFVVIFVCIVRRIIPQHVFPHQECAIFAHCVYLAHESVIAVRRIELSHHTHRFLIFRKPRAYDRLPVSAYGGWLKAHLWV